LKRKRKGKEGEKETVKKKGVFVNSGRNERGKGKAVQSKKEGGRGLFL